MQTLHQGMWILASSTPSKRNSRAMYPLEKDASEAASNHLACGLPGVVELARE